MPHSLLHSTHGFYVHCPILTPLAFLLEPRSTFSDYPSPVTALVIWYLILGRLPFLTPLGEVSACVELAVYGRI